MKNNIANTPTSVDKQKRSSKGQSIGTSEAASAIPVIGGTVQEQDTISVNAVAELKLQPLMKFPVSIGNLYDLTAMVDSGCHASLIRESVARELQLTLDPERKLLLKGVGTDNIQHGLGSVVCSINIHGIPMAQCRFNVISDMGMKYDFLLGRMFCHLNNLELDAVTRSIKKTNKNGSSWTLYENGLENNKCMIWTKIPYYPEKRTVIPKGSYRKVNVKPSECMPTHYNCKICDNKPKDELYAESDMNKNIETVPGLLDLEEVEVLVGHSGQLGKFTVNTTDILFRASTVVVLDKPNIVHAYNIIDSVSHGNQDITESTLNEIINCDLDNDEEKDRVLKMLLERRQVLSTSDEDICGANLSPHRIELYDDTPIREKPRRTPEPTSNDIEDQCKKLVAVDVIEPSHSPWSAPIVPIRKKDGSIRLCIDYRKLNKVTIPDRFPMPNVLDMVAGLKGVKYFTTLDLVRGYYQMPLAEESRPYTAFSTARNHYQFKRLPFGLRNAPSAFQRGMQEVLKGFPWNKVVVYIDDILIMESDFEKHLQLVEKVLATLEEHNIKVKVSKCEWFKKEVRFLGHQIGASGIRKTAEYVEKVLEYPKPVTVHDLQRFLGLVGFQRKFIQNFAELAKPLSCLTGGKRTARLTWTIEMEESFRTLRQELAKGVELAYPDYSEDSEPLDVVVDASGTGAGAYLAQKQIEEHRVIGFASMSFSPAQQRYSTTERELAALRWAVKTFRPYLYGVKFRLYTDHKPLIYLNNMKIADSRMSRTIEDLADFNFEIFYRPGKDNTIADLLSRLRHDESDKMDIHTGGIGTPIPSGLTLFPTAGGGDSLFESLYTVLSREQIAIPNSANDLRKIIIEEMKRSPKEYGLTPGRKTSTMLRLMEQPGQLPLTECIMACSKLFEVQIWVHMGMDNPIIFWPPSLKKDPITRVHLQSLAGIHYNALLEARSFTIPMAENLDQIIQDNLWRTEDPMDTETLPIQTVESTGVLEINTLFTTSTSLTRTCSHGTNPMSITILVHEIPTCAILDSGSQISLVNMGLLRRIEETTGISSNIEQDSNTKVVGMGEKVTPILGTVDLPIVLENGNRYTYPVAVMEEDQLPCCVILGLNILQQMKIKLDFGRMTIYREDNGFKQFLKTANDQSNEEYQCKKCWDTINTDSHHHTVTCFCAENLLHWKSWTEKTQDQLETAAVQCDENVSVEEVERNEPENDQESEQENHTENQQRYEGMLNLQEVKKMQSRDWKMRRVKNLVKREVEPKKWPRWLFNFKIKQKKITLKDGILWYHNVKDSVPLVNFRWLVDITTSMHNKMAHIGTEKLKDKVAKQLWHPKLSKVCQDVAVTCNWCQKNKPKTSEPSPPVIKIQTTKPFELVAVDLLQLPTTRFGNKYVLVATDHYSKWVSAAPLRNKSGSLVAKIMEEKILTSLTAKPEKILSDNGKEFKAKEFEQLLKSYGIRHIYSTPYKPSSNGAVERVNRTVIQILKGLVQSPMDWDKDLPRTIMIYNNTFHTEIKKSPSECLLEIEHRIHQSPVISQEIQKRWKDGNPKFEPFKKGDQVLIKLQKIGDMVQYKLTETFEGPYVIKRVFPNELTYQIATDSGQMKKAHYSQLKRFKKPPEYLGNEQEPFIERKKKSDKTDSDTTILKNCTSSSEEEDCDRIPPRTYFTDTDTEIEQLKNTCKRRTPYGRVTPKQDGETSTKERKIAKRYSRISVNEEIGSDNTQEVCQESPSETDYQEKLDECQLESSSYSSIDTMVEKSDTNMVLPTEHIQSSTSSDIPEPEPAMDEIIDTVADMESILHTCSEQLGSLNNICQESDKYEQYGQTPKMVLSSQVAHLQHVLRVIKRNGKIRDQLMMKGISDLRRASMPAEPLIHFDLNSSDTSDICVDQNNISDNHDQQSLRRSESEPAEINQNQDSVLEISCREKVSLGDLTFGDTESGSFEGFMPDSETNKDQNPNNKEPPESLTDLVTPTDFYIDRPHTRQRGKAVPIPNIMDRPLEFCKNNLKGGDT